MQLAMPGENEAVSQVTLWMIDVYPLHRKVDFYFYRKAAGASFTKTD